MDFLVLHIFKTFYQGFVSDKFYENFVIKFFNKKIIWNAILECLLSMYKLLGPQDKNPKILLNIVLIRSNAARLTIFDQRTKMTVERM